MADGDNGDLMNRRQFLKGGAATAAAVVTSTWAEKAEAQGRPDPKKNAYTILSRYAFTDNDGNDVSIDEIKNKIKDKYVTVTFGFSRCGGGKPNAGICPPTNAQLAKMAKQNDNLWHIVIGTDKLDNRNQNDRNNFMSVLKSHGMNPDRVIILHPKDRDLQDEMQRDFGATLIGSITPPGHTPYVFLHEPNGAQIGKKIGTDTNTAEVLGKLIPARQR
jgi:cytochrome oxidase Cu insertion factor (SCO1/SenC/PrrC family)